MIEAIIDFDRRGGRGAPDVVVRTNARGVIFFVSATCHVLGYRPEDLVGNLALDYVHPDDRARHVENTASLYRPGALSKSDKRVHRFKRKDGSWAWLRGNPKMLPSSNIQHGEVLNFFEPISEDAATKALQGLRRV